MAIALILPFLLAPGATLAAEGTDALLAEEGCLGSLAAVHQAQPTLSEQAVAQFLRSVHSEDCWSDLAFEEWSVETLYDLMQDAPETFFGALRQAPPPVQASVIKALDDPADQFIDYAAIYESISTGVRDKRLRDYALQIFSPHYQRYLKEQKQWERLDKPKGEAQEG